MTDRNAILEALTAKMEEIWNDDLSFADQAAAVLALVGPKPLVWTKHPNARIWRCVRDEYTYRVFGVGPKPTWDFDNPKGDYKASVVEDADEGFAAAQAHAAAAHWANTALGDLIGGEG